MDSSLIRPDNIWLIWAIVVGWAGIGMFLDRKYKWASTLTSCMIGLLGAMFLANLRIIPTESPVYDIIWDYVVPLAVPLLLFNADLKKIIRESGRTFAAFHISAFGTIIGCLLANYIFKKTGGIPELKSVSAMISASYIGGSVNLVAMKEAFGASSEITSAAVVADNLLMAVYFFVLAIIPNLGFFKKHFKHPIIDKVNSENRNTMIKANAENPITAIEASDLAISLAISFFIVAISVNLSNFINNSSLPSMFVLIFGQKYLLIATFSLILVSLFPKFFESLRSANILGELFINIFFVVIGVPASVSMILQKAPLLFVYAAVIVITNMAVSLGLGKIFGMNLEEIIISSNANIGGPTTAAALASSKRWDELVVPAVLVGVWGYVLANWIIPVITNLIFG